MKVAYIQSNKKTGTGAHYINDLIVSKLKEHHVDVECYYPHFQLADTPINFRGMNNILFFYSLLEKRGKILKCDIIQGTTYTPIAFMQFSIPVVSHFGSTNSGFLACIPKTSQLEKEGREVFYRLKKLGILSEIDLKSLVPLHDIANIEHYAARKADSVIATSLRVKEDLVGTGIDSRKIEVIHNAIEDYWFDTLLQEFTLTPTIVFLGRIGEDPFTLKLKGFDRLVYLYEKFPEIQKLSIIMSRSRKLLAWMRVAFPHHQVETNMIKENIPRRLAPYAGGILLITSRYEGFSLSLIEGMSQGLIPVSFPVGVALEIIRDGENGYIVNTLNEAEEKISLLLSNTSLRRKLSENARQTSEQFKSEILAQKMIELYARISKKK